MPNLILTEPRFPLHLPLARALFDKLCMNYNEAGARRLVAAASIQQAKIAWGKPMADVWYEILDEAAKSKLLERLLKEVSKDPSAAAIKDVVDLALSDGGPEGAASMLDTVLLPGDHPFLDRNNLRQWLRQLSTRAVAAPSVLLVRGDPATGKTATRVLVMQLAQALGDPTISFDEGNANEVGQVASRILKKLDRNKGVAESYTTPHAEYQKIWEEALDRASSTGQRLWLIVDDIGDDAAQASINRDVLGFFHKLAELLTKYPDDYAANFRLILLDYPELADRPPSKVNRDFLRRDVTSPLSEAHVRELVRTFWTSVNKRYSEADLESEATGILEDTKGRQAKPPSVSYAQALHDAMVDWMARQGQ